MAADRVAKWSPYIDGEYNMEFSIEVPQLSCLRFHLGSEGTIHGRSMSVVYDS